MIQSFRERMSGVIATALIILIAIPLAFFGVESLFMNPNRVVDIGEVNGLSISERDFQRARVVRTNQVRERLGEDYSSDMIDDEQMRAAALNDLVVQKIYLSAALDRDMGTSDARISQMLLNAPSFEMDGQFSEILFRNYLTQMGYTSAEFMDSYRRELTARQLTTAILDSGFSTNADVEGIVAVSEETRSYEYLQIPVESVLDQVEITDDQVQAYYQDNQDMFQQPEMLSVDYVRLSRDQFVDNVEASAEEVTERFEIMQAQQPTQREVAHILIEDGEGSAEKLAQVQERLAAGETFAAVAEELSDDVGSAANGGYLGMTAGDTFPAAFETAAAALEAGEVSEPVQTDAGQHLIKLIAIEESPLSLEEEYAGIELQVKREKAEALYVDALEDLRESALSTDELSQLIDEMRIHTELDVESTEPFQEDFGTGIAANERVRAVAFGPIVKEDRLNSEVVELSNTEAIVVHLDEHFPAGVAPLEQVRDEIVEHLQIERANSLLAERAEALRQEIEAGAKVEEIARREGLEWQVKNNQARMAADMATRQLFAVELTQELPLAGTIEQPQGGYLVYNLKAVEPGSLNEFSTAEQRQLRQQFGRQIAAAEFNAYTAMLREQADIDLKVDYGN